MIKKKHCFCKQIARCLFKASIQSICHNRWVNQSRWQRVMVQRKSPEGQVLGQSNASICNVPLLHWSHTVTQRAMITTKTFTAACAYYSYRLAYALWFTVQYSILNNNNGMKDGMIQARWERAILKQMHFVKWISRSSELREMAMCCVNLWTQTDYKHSPSCPYNINKQLNQNSQLQILLYLIWSLKTVYKYVKVTSF